MAAHETTACDAPDGESHPSPVPDITAVVCTKNRGPAIESTVTSILANDHENFALIVVDQSDDDRTSEVLQQFGDDPRVTYVRRSESGLGRARNVGLAHARSDLIAFTDDDVIVPKNWLTVAHAVLDRRPRCGVAFVNVGAGPHDESAGFVPQYHRVGTVDVTSVWEKRRARGIGAGLLARRSAVADVGGFDERLGAGSEFSSAEDWDIALRALLGGWHVHETDEVEVVHEGFRTWEEGKALTKRDWYGIGAAYSKPLKAGHWKTLPIALYEGIWVAAVHPFKALAHLQRPTGFKAAAYFWRGFARGLRTPVSKSSLTFDSHQGETSGGVSNTAP